MQLPAPADEVFSCCLAVRPPSHCPYATTRRQATDRGRRAVRAAGGVLPGSHAPLELPECNHPQAGNWPRAQALYEQQAALLRGAGMKPKLVFHLYTFSTLLYIKRVSTFKLHLFRFRLFSATFRVERTSSEAQAGVPPVQFLHAAAQQVGMASVDCGNNFTA